ncbi:sigma-70 family RNA polymerase sigma factor [Nonomuraea sp. NPDC049646]|uniref:sigma-70 family RNA polymerase sigma factor n=1 Tax=unclassified Nonomuraea TaxID=2593643 RepID=UPI0037A72574
MDAVTAVWREESARIVAGLARMLGDVGLAEEFAQDALVAALETWPRDGVPDRPGAWLTTAAKRRALDHLRRTRRHDQALRDLEPERPGERERPEQAEVGDDVLRLMFVSSHPVLPAEERTALTLRLLGGLTTAEIARAFLVREAVVAGRVARAKRTLAEEGVPFELPRGPELAVRLASVLEVIYLIFNEGYSATAGEDLMRPALALEALRLGRLLAGLAPGESEVHGLVALMEIQQSRADARTGPSGEPVQLHEQDRGRWNRELIASGFASMLRARAAGGGLGPYVLQAAIAVCHAQAAGAADTDWDQIAALYGALARLLPSPVVRLNQAVAVGMADGPEAGLALVDSLLSDPALRDYPPLSAVHGDLLARAGRDAEAATAFERAAALTRNTAERAFLLTRAARHRTASSLARAARHRTTSFLARTAGVLDASPLGEAADRFLARTDLDAGTIRSYGQTLRRLRLDLGVATPLAEITPALVARVFAAAWSTAAPRTWNRHRAAVRSFSAWAGLADLSAELPRKHDDRRRRPAVADQTLAALWRHPSPRERALWRLVHESGAPAAAVLALDVEDLDLPARRAATITWGDGAAALLEELVAGRTCGPLFLADRRPAPARTPDPADLCPETGRGRLSYERAEYLFKRASGGYTLHQLAASARRSAPAPRTATR